MHLREMSTAFSASVIAAQVKKIVNIVTPEDMLQRSVSFVSSTSNAFNLCFCEIVLFFTFSDSLLELQLFSTPLIMTSGCPYMEK